MSKSVELENKILEIFKNDVSFPTKGNVSVMCPLHTDTRPSASLNFNKQVFQCFAGCKGYNFKQLISEIEKRKNNNGHVTAKKEEIFKVQDNGHRQVRATKENFNKFVASRKISMSTLKELGAYAELDANHTDTYGYLVFPYNGQGYVARSFCNHELRYHNSLGEKGLYGYQKGQEEVFLVEGIFDLCAMRELGYKNVVCSLGSTLSKQQAYLLRKVTVYILYDLDYAGWSGAIEASKLLNEVGANPIMLELPEGNGKDINEVYIKNKKLLSGFLHDSMSKYDVTDISFVNKLFSGKDRPLTMFPTKIKDLDLLLNGGIIEGMHAITGVPATGKSALNLFLATRFVEAGANVLYATYEISTRQCWSRIASIYSKHTWANLEINPAILEKTVKAKISEIAKQLKIVAGWRATEIKRVSKSYDVIFIDYIQRMPGITEDSLTNINLNLNILSDLSRDDAKIIMIVSSVPRSHYDKEDSLGAFKESGNIEYQAQSATRLQKMADGELAFRVIKNTRGQVGNIVLKSKLDKIAFK